MIQLAGFTGIEVVFTGLRPGEKLYEELFEPSEAQDGRTEEGHAIALPRVIDKGLLHRTLSGIEIAAGSENSVRAVELLSHIVPEYKAMHPDEVAAGHGDSSADRRLNPTPSWIANSIGNYSSSLEALCRRYPARTMSNSGRLSRPGADSGATIRFRADCTRKRSRRGDETVSHTGVSSDGPAFLTLSPRDCATQRDRISALYLASQIAFATRQFDWIRCH